jgi:hypothetical protein
LAVAASLGAPFAAAQAGDDLPDGAFLPAPLTLPTTSGFDVSIPTYGSLQAGARVRPSFLFLCVQAGNALSDALLAAPTQGVLNLTASLPPNANLVVFACDDASVAAADALRAAFEALLNSGRIRNEWEDRLVFTPRVGTNPLFGSSSWFLSRVINATSWRELHAEASVAADESEPPTLIRAALPSNSFPGAAARAWDALAGRALVDPGSTLCDDAAPATLNGSVALVSAAGPCSLAHKAASAAAAGAVAVAFYPSPNAAFPQRLLPPACSPARGEPCVAAAAVPLLALSRAPSPGQLTLRGVTVTLRPPVLVGIDTFGRLRRAGWVDWADLAGALVPFAARFNYEWDTQSMRQALGVSGDLSVSLLRLSLPLTLSPLSPQGMADFPLFKNAPLRASLQQTHVWPLPALQSASYAALELSLTCSDAAWCDSQSHLLLAANGEREAPAVAAKRAR